MCRSSEEKIPVKISDHHWFELNIEFRSEFPHLLSGSTVGQLKSPTNKTFLLWCSEILSMLSLTFIKVADPTEFHTIQ